LSSAGEWQAYSYFARQVAKIASMTVTELDAMPESQAMEMLRECCGSSRWVDRMLAQRPFGSREAVLAAADEIWASLDGDDRREAFAYHPRIGEQTTSSITAREQSGVSGAADDVRLALAKANRDYEQRFGYIYIVCATGKSAEEMLAIAKSRLQNDPDKELRVAAEEQRKITRLRLQKLLED
jgi:2-oxo-4-hydroxy-4-carboxy-5-ureidoimidazoline decarboxylase